MGAVATITMVFISALCAALAYLYGGLHDWQWWSLAPLWIYTIASIVYLFTRSGTHGR